MKSIILRYGLLLALVLLVLFSLALAAGFLENPTLRVFNGVFHFGLIYMAVRKYRVAKGTDWNYASGTGVGVLAGMLGTLIFAIAVGLFLAARPEVLADIAANTHVAQYLNPLTAALVLCVEGFAVTVFSSYFSMRLVDADRSVAVA